jgi:hypothetical protein
MSPPSNENSPRINGESSGPMQNDQHEGQQENQQHEDDVVTPWDVVAKNSTGVDYEKLIRKCPTNIGLSILYMLTF